MAGLICVAGLGLGAPAVQAADVEGNFAIKGGGLQSCAAFQQAFDSKSVDLRVYAGWIDGYVTGLNQFSNETYDLASWQGADTLLVLTHAVCRQRPGETRFFEAFLDIARLLAPGRLQEEDRLIALVQKGATGTAVYDSVLRTAKTRLREAGFDPATSDSSFTEETAAAFRAYQASQGLPVTGLPDQKTLYALLRN